MSNFERIQKRLRRDRPMVSVTLRMPEDVVDDLKFVAPALGFSGYQPLIRAYVGRGLREDLERLDGYGPQSLIENLRRHGIDESVLAQAIAETAEAKSGQTTG
ncbi:MAG: hypothetical protein AB7T20_09845 [Steroidobacteraceae bacterium]